MNASRYANIPWGINRGLDGFGPMTMKRRIIRAGGWGIAKRLIKPIPIVGTIFAFSLAGYEIQKKGLIPGAVHVGLDVTPVVAPRRTYSKSSRATSSLTKPIGTTIA